MSLMKLAFTGTCKGMSENQKKQLINRLETFQKLGYEFEWHHGCCVGADVEFDGIVRHFKSSGYLHPSNIHKTTIDCFELEDVLYLSLPPIVRNHIMVDVSDTLIAAPDSDTEKLRSGTWATVRYARKKGINIFILER